MPKNDWYNTIGTVGYNTAPTPGGTPNYGLTLDAASSGLTTDEARELVEGITAAIQPWNQADEEEDDDFLSGAWRGFSKGVSKIGDIAQTGLGMLVPDEDTYDTGVERVTSPELEQWVKDHPDEPFSSAPQEIQDSAYRDSDTGEAITEQEAADKIAEGPDFYERALATGERRTGQAVELPGVKQAAQAIDYGLGTVSTPFLTESYGGPFSRSAWSSAWRNSHDRHFTPGEAFVSMFYDDEKVRDKDRWEYMRANSGVLGFSSLALDTVASWYVTPEVIGLKTAGATRNRVQGQLADAGRAAEVQRDVLGSVTREQAMDRVTGYTGVMDRVRARRALTLYDRSVMLRQAAKDQDLVDFQKNTAFTRSPSGVVMAKLFKDAADNDQDWNLIFRSSMGDSAAFSELVTRRGEYADKIAAIEMKSLPNAERELSKVEERYQKRLVEKGLDPSDPEARLAITNPYERFLEDDLDTRRIEVEGLRSKLQAYESYNDWLTRATPGYRMGDDYDTFNINESFNALSYVGSKGKLRSLDDGGRVTTWQFDEWSPVVRNIRGALFTKRADTVNLNDVQKGHENVRTHISQLGSAVEREDFDVDRYYNRFLDRWAGTTTDVQRAEIVGQLERDTITAIGQKHGLSKTASAAFAQAIQDRRKVALSNIQDEANYSPIPGKKGWVMEVVDDDGNMQRIEQPLDPSQLKNYYALVSPRDIDAAFKRNADLIRQLDLGDEDLPDAPGRLREKVSKAERWTETMIESTLPGFTSLWKASTLLSLRWPMRMVGEESLRAYALVGAMPMMYQQMRAAGASLNNGVLARPFEWVRGRKVRTGTPGGNSLRPDTPEVDAFDYRGSVNPTNIMPARAVDFGRIDQRRYDRITKAAAERTRDVRRGFATGPNPNAIPKWMSDWDARLADAESSTARGFFFDPTEPNQLTSKGFAVSVYPGRLVTFKKKPTAREMTYFIEQNADLLAIRFNRVATWLDTDTGRWHLDVVKTPKTKADAMRLAEEAGATEFFDIEDGFTRYLSEDYYGQITGSPFADQAVDAPDATDAGLEAEPLAATKPQRPNARLAASTGTLRFKDRNGRVVETARVYGDDSTAPNIYYGANSSRGAMLNYVSGSMGAVGKYRGARAGRNFRTYEGNEDGWAESWADFVNKHVRTSPIGQRMLAGESDEQIIQWVKSPAGRDLRKRMGGRGEYAEEWVEELREVFDHLFTTERSVEAARLGDIDPKGLDDLIPKGNKRNPIHWAEMQESWTPGELLDGGRRLVESTMGWLASVPTDTLVRHPLAQVVYNREMKKFLSGVDSETLSQDVLKAAEGSARLKAHRAIEKALYTMSDEYQFAHMLRYLSPFLQAQLEVLEKWKNVVMERPEALARLALVSGGWQSLASATQFGAVQVQDGLTGEPAQGYGPDNVLTMQLPEAGNGFTKAFYKAFGLDQSGSLEVPTRALDWAFGGETPWHTLIPSAGPWLAIPVSKFVYSDHPERTTGDGVMATVYKGMFPVGQPKDVIDALSPAWLKRMRADVGEDAAYAVQVRNVYAQQYRLWEEDGRVGDPPSFKDAEKAVAAQWRLRAASSVLLPFAVDPEPRDQFYIDLYHSYQDKYGLEADEKFWEDHPEYYLYTEGGTSAPAMGGAATVESKKLFDQNIALVQRKDAYDMLGVLVGPGSGGEFNYEVYQWQLGKKYKPGSDDTLRELTDPTERIRSAEESRGWLEYNKYNTALQVELRARAAQGGSLYITASDNADLKQMKDQLNRQNFEQNPAWQTAYLNGGDPGEMNDLLRQAYSVAFDSSLDKRDDMLALRAYLLSRVKMQEALLDRREAGLSTSASFSLDPAGNPTDNGNQDLFYAWQSYVSELSAQNPLFAEMYSRYFERDDLSIYIDPEGVA